MTEKPEQPEVQEEDAAQEVMEDKAPEADQQEQPVLEVAEVVEALVPAGDNAEDDADEVEIEFVQADGETVAVDDAEDASEETPGEEVTTPVEAVSEETADEEEEVSADPFTVQQQDDVIQAINPLEEGPEPVEADGPDADESPITVVDENRKPARQPGLPEIFFKSLDDGLEPADAFTAVRAAQLERNTAMPEDELQMGLDAAQTAFQDAMETGSSPEEAFVLAGDAAARVMASRGMGRAA